MGFGSFISSVFSGGSSSNSSTTANKDIKDSYNTTTTNYNVDTTGFTAVGNAENELKQVELEMLDYIAEQKLNANNFNTSRLIQQEEQLINTQLIISNQEIEQAEKKRKDNKTIFLFSGALALLYILK